MPYVQVYLSTDVQDPDLSVRPVLKLQIYLGEQT